MSYTPCSFDRSEYLLHATVFEMKTLDDVEFELSEHNHDADDLAYELAYTRYRVAKLESALEDIAGYATIETHT